VEEILELAGEAGAAYVSGIALHLRGEVKGLFFDWLQDHRPDLVPRYRQLYKRGAYAPAEERARLGRLVKGPDLEPAQRMRGRVQRARQVPSPRVPQPVQERLFR
jgi:DNA repair photolyase